jgi:hypothetical protein
MQYTINMGTNEIYDYLWFFIGTPVSASAQVAESLGVKPGDEVYYWPRRGFDIWNTRYFIVPAFPNGWRDKERSFASSLEKVDRVYPPPGSFQGPGGADLYQHWLFGEDLQILRSRTAYPRAWVVHKVRFHKPITGPEQSERAKPMGEILFANDALWNDTTRQVFDPKVLAWVDTATGGQLANALSGTDPTADETVKITAYEPQRVELDATLQRPGVVVLSDIFYPGWHLTIDGVEATIYQVNLMMRGALVLAGKHHLVYTYRPDSFYKGRWVSVAGLAVLGLLAVWVRRHPLARGFAATGTGGDLMQ